MMSSSGDIGSQWCRGTFSDNTYLPHTPVIPSPAADCIDASGVLGCKKLRSAHKVYHHLPRFLASKLLSDEQLETQISELCF